PEQATLRAGAAGFVSALAAAPGARVRAGATLIHSVDPALDAQIRLAEARVAELEATYGNEFVADRARAEIVREQWRLEQEALERLRERAAGLTAAAQADGVFTVAKPADMPGRHYRQGQILGYVLGSAEPIIRVVVEQSEVDALGLV